MVGAGNDLASTLLARNTNFLALDVQTIRRKRTPKNTGKKNDSRIGPVPSRWTLGMAGFEPARPSGQGILNPIWTPSQGATNRAIRVHDAPGVDLNAPTCAQMRPLVYVSATDPATDSGTGYAATACPIRGPPKRVPVGGGRLAGQAPCAHTSPSRRFVVPTGPNRPLTKKTP